MKKLRRLKLTVFENLELSLLYVKFSSSEWKKKVNEAMDKMQIMYKKNIFLNSFRDGNNSVLLSQGQW